MESKEKPQSKSEFKAILRLADREVKGETSLFQAIARASGSGFMFANAIVKALKLDRSRQVGALSSSEIEKIELAMKNPEKHNIPKWLFNRQKDLDSGEDRHLISSDLDLTKKFDIRRQRKIKSYVGMRHSRGEKGLKVRVRGQRTRTTGRRGKTMGVVRKKK